MLLSYRNDNERVTLEQQDVKQTHTEKEKDIYTIYKKYPLGSTWIMRRLPQDNGTNGSPHTGYRWRGERVIEPIKCMRSPHQLQVERKRSRANEVFGHTI